MTHQITAFAAFSLKHGIACTSIRYQKSETEYWIEKERKAGQVWEIIEIIILLK